MQEMIERIVEIDRKARQSTAEANELRISAEREIEEKKNILRAQYIEKARKRIEVLTLEEQKLSDEDFEVFDKLKREIMNSMEKRFNENGEKWVDAIVDRVMRAGD